MRYISELKDLNKDTLPGSHITVHLAAKYIGISPDTIDGHSFYHDYAKHDPKSRVKFGIPAFPGAKTKLKKKKSTPQRYDGEWVIKLIKLLYSN